jgi:hypothetical protein
MENLWERLKPELKAAVIEYYKPFPNSFNDLKEKLENERFYNNLPYWVYTDLRYLTSKMLKNIDYNLSNYFLPH